MSMFRGVGPVSPPTMTMADNLPPVTSVDTTTGRYDRYNPTPSFQVLNPNARTPHTHYNAPQAYGLNAVQLRTVIIGQIRETQGQTWYTTDALPRVEIRGQVFGWSVIQFDEALAEITPYEGVPRLLTSRRNDQTRSMLRRAIAVFTEESYRVTAEGESMYALAMRHIATVVKETQNFEVVMAYFNCKNYNMEWELKYGYFNNKTIALILDREVTFFAAIQKFGFAKLDAIVLGYHSRYGVEDLDMWILPREVRVFCGTVLEENTLYYKGGEQAVDQVKNSIGRMYDDVGPALIFGNVYKIYFTRTYAVDDQGKSANPMLREKMIGDYIPMVSSGVESGHGYKSNHRIVEFYDEDLDDDVMIGLEKALGGIDYMFNEEGKLKTVDDLVANKRQHVHNFENDILQHFLYRGYTPNGSDVPEPIDLIGEMRQEHFSTNSQLEMAKSIVEQIGKNMGCDEKCNTLYQAFSAGIELVRKTTKTSVSHWLTSVPTVINDEYFPIEQEPDERVLPSQHTTILPFDTTSGTTVTKKMGEQANSGLLDLESLKKLDFLTSDDIYPYMSNWPGLVYLAERKFSNSNPLLDSVIKTITNFVDAVRKIVHFSKNLLVGNPLFAKEYTLPFYPVQSEENVFLNNLGVFHNSVPVWISVRSARDPKDRKPAGRGEVFPNTINNDATILPNLKTTVERILETGSPETPYQANISRLIQILYSFANVDGVLELGGNGNTTLNSFMGKLNGPTYANASAQVVDIYVTALVTIAAERLFRVATPGNAANSTTAFNEVLAKPSDFSAKIGPASDYAMLGAIGGTTNQAHLLAPRYVFTKQDFLLDVLVKSLEKSKDANYSDGAVPKLIAELFKSTIANTVADAPQAGFNGTGGSAVVNLGAQKVLEAAVKDELFATDDASDYKILLDDVNPEDLVTTSSTPIAAKRKGAQESLNPGSKVGAQHARTTFTLSYEQLQQYLAVLKKNPGLSSGTDKVPFMTVSLPTSGYNKPASIEEIEDFLSNTPNLGKGSLPSNLPGQVIKNIEAKFDLSMGRKVNVSDRNIGILLQDENQRNGAYAMYNEDIEIPAPPNPPLRFGDIKTGGATGRTDMTQDTLILETFSQYLHALLLARELSARDMPADFIKLEAIITYMTANSKKIPKSVPKFYVKGKTGLAGQKRTFSGREDEYGGGEGEDDSNFMEDDEIQQPQQSGLKVNAKGKFAAKRGAEMMDDDEDENNVLGSMMGQKQQHYYGGDDSIFEQDYSKSRTGSSFQKQQPPISTKIGAKFAKVVTPQELSEHKSKRQAIDKGFRKAPKQGAWKNVRTTPSGKPPKPSDAPMDYERFQMIRPLDLILYHHSSTYGANPILTSNWMAIDKLPIYELDKLMAFAVLTTPTIKQNFVNFVWYDIILPMNFLLLRPHMRYEMAAGIKTRGGLDTGGTFVNVEQENMMEGDNVTDKTRLTHYSYESKAEVTNESRVFIAYDIFCFSTIGGAGSEFYTLEDLTDYSSSEHHYPNGKSIFVAPIPYEERDFPNVIDASGTFSHYKVQGYTDGRKAKLLHYSTAALLNALFGFRDITDRGFQDVETWYHPRANGEFTPSFQPKNTAMFRTYYGYYDARVGKMVRRNGTGHFKSFAYPGVKENRNRGLKAWIAPVL